jgi:hypothetical protein
VAAVTVSVAVPVTPPKVAAIVVLPTVLLVARPLLLIVATAVSDEAHVTVLLTS